MPKQPVKGTKQVLLELPEGLVADAKAFAASRGETLKEVVIGALRRHMAYPPQPKPPPVPPPIPDPDPLPDAEPAPPAEKKRKRK
jgi:hypothetical protein